MAAERTGPLNVGGPITPDDLPCPGARAEREAPAQSCPASQGACVKRFDYQTVRRLKLGAVVGARESPAHLPPTDLGENPSMSVPPVPPQYPPFGYGPPVPPQPKRHRESERSSGSSLTG